MRRSSVVAPLLLIGIGGLFLFRNLYPDLPLMDYLARYWPVLLIIWGGLRLAEILIWASTNRPLPKRGVSGGEWILIILLCMFGGALYVAKGGWNDWWGGRFRFSGIEMFGESFEYSLAGEKAASKTPRIIIDSFRGNARIVGADVTAVKVTGHKTIRSMDQNRANETDRQTPLELVGEGDQITIRTNQDRVAGENRATADMEITVPKGASIEAHGRRGDFDITDINGNVEIVSDNAGVRLQNIGGEARVDLRASDIIRATNVKGGFDLKGRGHDIELQSIDGPVTITGSYTGVLQFRAILKPLRFHGERTELSVEKIGGQLRMPIGQFTAMDLTGPMRLTTRNRDVSITDFTNSLEVSVDRGDIELRPAKLPLGRLDIHTRSGQVELALPAASKFEMSATAARGDISNEFGGGLHQENDRRGATLRGTVGGGGPTINIQSERGQITVRKASADDATGSRIPEPPAVPGAAKGPKELKPIDQ